jgi:CheY-like chemotaxis protein
MPPKNRTLTVLLADRNPRIRDFILRELRSDGHHVLTAANAIQIIRWLESAIQLDVLILDPNMPGIDSKDKLELILSLKPHLPIVFHCLSPDPMGLPLKMKAQMMIEKNGNSIDDLKQMLKRLFQPPVSPE